MPAAVDVPTIPGVTAEQVRCALALAGQVYASAGVRVRMNAVETRETGLPNEPVIELEAWVLDETDFALLGDLVTAVPAALREAGLYEPAIPIASHLIPAW